MIQEFINMKVLEAWKFRDSSPTLDNLLIFNAINNASGNNDGPHALIARMNGRRIAHLGEVDLEQGKFSEYSPPIVSFYRGRRDKKVKSIQVHQKHVGYLETFEDFFKKYETELERLF